MGIKYFFSWLRKTFRGQIQTVSMGDRSFADRVKVDTLLIDMNGVYHYCAQKIFRYAGFEDKDSPAPPPTDHNARQMYRLVGDYLDQLIRFVAPRQRVVLAVDGPAPLAKQAQQRSRRFRSALLHKEGTFDSSSITPGTIFMHRLTLYIDWWIRKRVSDGAWGGIDVIFSSEKAPGEGEHKLVEWVRRYGTDQEVYMMYGMDADLVMLSLATHRPHFHVLRDEPNREYLYYHINLEQIRAHLANALLSDNAPLDDRVYIIDFVAMVAFTGNDFLPHLPTIEILGGGLENLLATYRAVSRQYGSLTTPAGTLHIPALQAFLGTLGLSQESDLLQAYNTPIEFPDKLLARFITAEKRLDWEGYRRAYYSEKMGCNTEEEIMIACLKYIDGLQWVLTYYTRGTPHSHWKWFYPYHHAPFLTDMAKYAANYCEWADLRPRGEAKKAKKSSVQQEKIANRYDVRSPNNRPFPPLLQLLSVLPPTASGLLPAALGSLMTCPRLVEYYPTEFEVDMDGKRKDYEGVALLPVLDYEALEQEYQLHQKEILEKEAPRNRYDAPRVYRKGDMIRPFRSFYGDLEQCKTTVTTVAL